MRQYPILAILTLIVVLLVLDIYTFKGVRVLSVGLKPLYKYSIFIAYWLFTASLLATILYASLNYTGSYNQSYNQLVSYLVGVTLLTVSSKLVFCFFQGVGDAGHYIAAFFKTIFSNTPTGSESMGGELIDRRAFVTKLGLAIAAVPFISISYGIVKGRFDYKVFKEWLRFGNLPKAFDGLKVVQLSDLHLGSFHGSYDKVAKGIDKVNRLKPDIIVFTGDIVNNYAQETEGWKPVLEKLHAPLGKYAVLGNHDYGDYGQWTSQAAKQENFEKIKQFLKDCGFRLLMNETETITVDGETIDLVGVENWGRPPFKQYGDLKKALEKSNSSFKILLSHDPSHWDAEVLKKEDIDITLAGHTHGAQFGVEIAGLKWSPVKMKYPRWGGLYQEGKQYLYVNRGFGYIGFPGRVGISPEITLLNLESTYA